MAWPHCHLPGPRSPSGTGPSQLQPGISLVDMSISGWTWPGPGSHQAVPLPSPNNAPCSASFTTPCPALRSFAWPQCCQDASCSGFPGALAPANSMGEFRRCLEHSRLSTLHPPLATSATPSQAAPLVPAEWQSPRAWLAGMDRGGGERLCPGKHFQAG